MFERVSTPTPDHESARRGAGKRLDLPAALATTAGPLSGQQSRQPQTRQPQRGRLRNGIMVKEEFSAEAARGVRRVAEHGHALRHAEPGGRATDWQTHGARRRTDRAHRYAINHSRLNATEPRSRESHCQSICRWVWAEAGLGDRDIQRLQAALVLEIRNPHADAIAVSRAYIRLGSAHDACGKGPMGKRAAQNRVTITAIAEGPRQSLRGDGDRQAAGEPRTGTEEHSHDSRDLAGPCGFQPRRREKCQPTSSARGERQACFYRLCCLRYAPPE